jgi:hypothetical protein
VRASSDSARPIRANMSAPEDQSWPWRRSERAFAYAFTVEPTKGDDGVIRACEPWRSHWKAIAGAKLHPHGAGPFCDYPVPLDIPNEPGVYVFVIDGRVMYVGKSGQRRGIRKRLCEYHRICGRQCFDGGPRTTCYVNANIYKHAAAGCKIDVYVLPISDFNAIEADMIHRLRHPPWNVAKCTICGHANGK